VKYAYQVRAIPLRGGGIVSVSSNEAQATASAAWNHWRPTNLSAHRASRTSVRLTWQDNSNGEVGFDVERMDLGKKPPSWTRVGSVRTDQTTFTDPGISADGTYGYRVRAYGSGNLHSSYSNEVLVKPQGGPPAP